MPAVEGQWTDRPDVERAAVRRGCHSSAPGRREQPAWTCCAVAAAGSQSATESQCPGVVLNIMAIGNKPWQVEG